MFSRLLRRVGNTTDPTPSQSFEDERIASLLQPAEEETMASERREEILQQLIALHETLRQEDERAAREVRRAFLLVVRLDPSLLTMEEIGRFMVTHIDPDDFARLQWTLTSEVLTFYDALHDGHFHAEVDSEHVMNYTIGLIRHALRQFERNGQYDKMFQLLQQVPVPTSQMDSELLRLRERAYFHEMQRVRRRRKLLYGYLVLQVVLVFMVFPLLFINAENGLIQDRIEEATEVDIEENPARYRTFSYSDGLYWSLITAGSIGYGDITPQTRVGKVIAASLGLMGVITIGVIAGLILNWITPRRL